MNKRKLSCNEKEFFWNLATNNTQNLNNIYQKLEDKDKLFAYCNAHNIEEHFHGFLEKNIWNSQHNNNGLSFANLVKKKKIQTLMNIEAGLQFCDDLYRNNINYVTLKGLSYIDNIDVNERLFRDLDILVDIKDIEKSVKIAQKNGFEFENNRIFRKDFVTKSLDKYCLPQMYNKNNVVLELHYRIEANEFYQCKFSSDMLAEKKLINAFGHKFFAPTNQFKFIHLAYHAVSKGNFDVGISAIFDLFLFKKKGMIDPIKINQLAQNYNFNFDLDIFNLVIKDSEKKIKNSYDQTHLSMIKGLFLQPKVNKRITGYHLASGFVEKIKYILKFLFADKEILKRDFNFTNPIILYLSLPIRWMRQISIKSFSFKNFLLNYNDERERAKIILNLKRANLDKNIYE